jgi:hypothetical protein
MALIEQIAGLVTDKYLHSVLGLNRCPLVARSTIDLSGIGKGIWLPPGPYPASLDVEIRFFSFMHDKDAYWGSLVAVFNPLDWPTNKFGLLYTDPWVVQEVARILDNKGLHNFDDFEWSEQGRQDAWLMDFDLGNELALELARIYPDFAEEEMTYYV